MALSLDHVQQKRSVKVRPKSKRKTIPKKTLRPWDQEKAAAKSAAKSVSNRRASSQPATPFPFRGKLAPLNGAVAKIWLSTEKILKSGIVRLGYTLAASKVEEFLDKNKNLKLKVQNSGLNAQIERYSAILKNFEKKMQPFKK